MKNSQITEYAILNGAGTVLYIAFVALIMRQVPILFGEMESTFLGPIAFLLLFVISATVTGSLVLGKPIMLYIDGHKKEAVKLFLGTALVLIGALFVTFCVLLYKAI